jgi:hypothetical protein
MHLKVIKSSKPEKDYEEWRQQFPELVVRRIQTFRYEEVKFGKPKPRPVKGNPHRKVVPSTRVVTYELFISYDLPSR